MIFPVEHPGPWPQFLKRKDNIGLPLMEVKQKYLKEEVEYADFISSITKSDTNPSATVNNPGGYGIDGITLFCNKDITTNPGNTPSRGLRRPGTLIEAGEHTIKADIYVWNPEPIIIYALYGTGNFVWKLDASPQPGWQTVTQTFTITVITEQSLGIKVATDAYRTGSPRPIVSFRNLTWENEGTLVYSDNWTSNNTDGWIGGFLPEGTTASSGYGTGQDVKIEPGSPNVGITKKRII